MTQKEIAESNNMSQAKVTRAIQCASVSSDIVAVFPVIAELSYPDYKSLLDVTIDIKKNKFSIDEVVSCVRDEVQHIDKVKPVSPDEMKSNIIKLFKYFSSNKVKKLLKKSSRSALFGASKIRIPSPANELKIEP